MIIIQPTPSSVDKRVRIYKYVSQLSVSLKRSCAYRIEAVLSLLPRQGHGRLGLWLLQDRDR
jgi:hypothetical protein